VFAGPNVAGGPDVAHFLFYNAVQTHFLALIKVHALQPRSFSLEAKTQAQVWEVVTASSSTGTHDSTKSIQFARIRQTGNNFNNILRAAISSKDPKNH
jgi:hypothetical protein